MDAADRIFRILTAGLEAERAKNPPPKGESSLEASWIRLLKMEIDDAWDWIISALADSRPSEIAYIRANYNHEKIMQQYAMMLSRK